MVYRLLRDRFCPIFIVLKLFKIDLDLEENFTHMKM